MARIKDIEDKVIMRKAIDNCINHRKVENLTLMNVEHYLFKDIDAAFRWSITIEGQDFWRNLNAELDSINK